MKLTTFFGVAAACMLGSGATGFALSGPSTGAPPATVSQLPAPPTNPTTPASLFQQIAPAQSASFDAGETLHVTGRLGHPTLAAGRGAETFVHLDLTTDLGLEAASNAPLNLSIVMDRSRSMKGQRMTNALAAARGMIDRLHDGDTVSVVAYNTQSTVLIPPTTISAFNRADVQLRLRNIEARGHTCISCGVESGLQQLSAREGAVSRLLLLSDGQANTGIRDEDGFRQLAARAQDRGVTVSSLGVDVDYDERLMLAIAQASNGRHYFVEDPSGLPRIFEEELRSLKQTVASGVEAVLTLAPGVEVAQVFDRAFSRRGDEVVVPFGTFAAGDEKSLLMKVRLSRSDAGLREVVDVKLRYRDLTSPGGTDATCEGALAASMTSDAALVSPLDPFVETRLARAETSAALLSANAQFSAGNLAGARATLEDTKGRIRTRRKSIRGRVRSPKKRAAIERGFENPFAALDGASSNFDAAEAQAPAPAAAPTSRAGKSSVRSNADALSGLGL